jgi:spermidine synthase
MGVADQYQGSLVFSCKDEYGPIDVVDEATARTMHFGTPARQSTMLRSAPSSLALAYTQCMAGALLFSEEPGRILLLGLGGGSLAKYLLAHHPGCSINAVELRAQVVELARAFFALPDDPRLRISVSSAEHYLDTAATEAAVVALVDIYDRSGMAPAQGLPVFFSQCRAQMAACGVLAINLWTGGRGAMLSSVRRNMRTAFHDQVLELPVSGKLNTVALGFCQPLADADWERASHRAAAWKKRGGVDFEALLSDLHWRARRLSQMP